MPKKNNEQLLDKVKQARATEKIAIADAKVKLEALLREWTKDSHDALLEAVRVAVLDGVSTRQIGFAYGSSDPHTAKRLVDEAMADVAVENASNDIVNGWKITPDKNDNSLFTIKVYGFGDSKQNGEAVMSLDEDEVNITTQDGDFWIAVQLYKNGLVPSVIEDYWKERNK